MLTKLPGQCRVATLESKASKRDLPGSPIISIWELENSNFKYSQFYKLGIFNKQK
jgi:hypothetical protein